MLLTKENGFEECVRAPKTDNPDEEYARTQGEQTQGGLRARTRRRVARCDRRKTHPPPASSRRYTHKTKDATEEDAPEEDATKMLP